MATIPTPLPRSPEAPRRAPGPPPLPARGGTRGGAPGATASAAVSASPSAGPILFRALSNARTKVAFHTSGNKAQRRKEIARATRPRPRLVD